jgi:uncharacterized Rmd1/YagE family protein
MDNNMKCNTHYLSLNIEFKKLCIDLQRDHKTRLYRDVIHIQENNSDIFVFQYGSIVFWNVEHDRQKYFIEYVGRFCEDIIENRYQETVEFEISDEARISKITKEVLVVPSQNVTEEKLACSYALAQSNNLDYFEHAIERLIKKTRHIPKVLQHKGKIEMNAKQISQLIGEILYEKHSINLHFNLIEKPEFFWEHSDLDKSYTNVSRYLEITNRVEVMNNKLEVLHELVQVLSEEQKHTYGSYLELIVIWLIAIEIVLSLISIFAGFSH